MINHISIFLPSNSAFYCHLFIFLSNAFKQIGLNISGGCKLLTNDEMKKWISAKKPCVIFEMNRVKDEIPLLHELNIPHISWVVDFQGRDETHIKGSDITYFFDPDWDENYTTGKFQDWLPPGTCTDTFYPFEQSNIKINYDFSFIGHIPKPWSHQKLSKPLKKDKKIKFETLLNRYTDHLKSTELELRTHKDLLDIIKKLTKQLIGTDTILPNEMYYDLMERTKRMENRSELINFARKKTESIAIYGSKNWIEWHQFLKFYKHFVECPSELNHIHQNTKRNLHDGLSFHFRAIDCLASGGQLFYHNNRLGKKPRRGLHDFFNNKFHFIEFRKSNFDDAYEISNQLGYFGNKAQNETIKIISSNHTWQHRAKKIIKDINSL